MSKVWSHCKLKFVGYYKLEQGSKHRMLCCTSVLNLRSISNPHDFSFLIKTSKNTEINSFATLILYILWLSGIVRCGPCNNYITNIKIQNVKKERVIGKPQIDMITNDY